jgi:hypothetical protein
MQLVPLRNGTSNSLQHGKCKQAYANAARDPAKCAPWSETYGFYTGDDGGVSIEMELEIVDMNYAQNSHQIGNMMNGVASFTHWYPVGRSFTAMVGLNMLTLSLKAPGFNLCS